MFHHGDTEMSAALLSKLLDSMKDPVVFCDLEHVIHYMNRPAILHYKEGAALLGRSVMECHNEQSRRMILEIAEALKLGEEERLIRDDEKMRIFMRAVREPDGGLIGYYERYEPPRMPAPVAPEACP